MKRLYWKIFALAASVSTCLALAAVAIAPPGAFAGVAFLKLAGLGLAGSLLVSWLVGRMSLDPLDQVRALAAGLATGRRDQRLLWSYGDERDETAISLNRTADRLVREIDEAHREAQQLQAVLSAMVEGVLVLDVQDRIVLVNPGFRELFRTWGPVRDRTLIEVIRQPEVHDLLADAKTTRDAVIRDLPLRGAGDRTILAHAIRFPAEGPPAGTLAVFQDVTEVRRVDKVRRDFIANASHELRTPLTSIQGFAETLASGGLGPEDADRCLETILRNVGRMRDLIDDLMELSRIENQASVAELTRVDVVRLTRELLVDLGKRLSSAELEAELVTRSAPDAWCDRSALEHVLENLLTNAIRYTDAGGRIRILIEPKAELLEVTVEDTGIGIPEKSLGRIFERFYRVDASRTRAVGSTGLGLAIVRHLVQAMGGTIRVESELGVGSRFIFTIPRAREDAETGA
ncbi:MAG: ATP-binding protein [bacterium]|nr:ATP-binding protein [bacterium]